MRQLGVALFCLTAVVVSGTFVGCGSKSATVVEQPKQSAEELAQQAADYDAEMNAN